MYIPTQEERYAKKGFVSLILCVVVPSCLYVSLLSKQLMMVRGHEWEAIMKIFLAFTYPLAALFAMTAFRSSGGPWASPWRSTRESSSG